ncbi:MAG: elongation factor P [Microgenomates group bacterium]|jgi:elongation factor P|nr:elongation factor P [Candidatus Woesebacteria bacterium]
MKIEAGSVKKGDFLNQQGDIWQVLKTEFNYQGRGQANIRIRMKSVTNTKTLELNFKTTVSLETADVDTIEMQYLYKDTESLYFMNERTYQQIAVPTETVDFANYLKEGNKYFVVMHGEDPLSVRPPANVHLEVVSTEDAVKGDTVSGAKKLATLETGLTVMVPLFVKKGDVVSVSAETGLYVERVKQ